MALRLAVLRRFSKATPLGLESAQAKALKESVTDVTNSVKSFSFSTFFEEKNFWQKANVGPFFILLFFTPSIYRSFKDWYWTRQLRKLNTEEIISDRYEWLKLNMLKDEVEAELLKQIPQGGIKPLELGPALPP
mmetsp:Transcript_113649/g.222879  ORF Transcript_113649/g.222879 Transcript_113649/m.222879 type:complete len:134 (-) Transcript_113649:89-490(-)